MHISLDSALGRQRRLNSVGESVLQIAPNAAAAYSLRSLTGGDPKVVRVRRASDNGERDFTGSEITSGEMVSWVNQQVIKPLDIQALEADGRTGDFLIAKAAYALRSLGTRQATLAATGDTVARADDKFVAQVRRNVNGDLKSFTATEVTDGTLTSFVNESFTSSLPLDVSGSASAAYGLRNLSSTYSGNVVEVRRSSDDTTQNFTATEITDGTLLAFVGTGGSDNGHVKTWYDQSGNSRDAVQATAASQPKIVDAGVLVTDRDGKLALNGKGAKLDLPTNAPMLSTDGTYSLFAVVDFDDQRNGNDNFNNILRFDSTTAGGAASARKPLVYLDQTSGALTATSPSFNSGSVNYTLAETLSVQLFANIANPTLSTGNNTAYADGALVGSANTATSVNTNNLLSSSSRIFENQETTVTHFLSEVIYYPSDQSDKRRAIEESISGHYGITLGSFNRDGFVKTWYDQSVTNEAGDTATGNHAVQATAASQPKIVSAGTLLNELDFDGTDDNFELTSVLGMTSAGAIFSVAESGGGDDKLILDNRDGGVDGFRLLRLSNDLEYRWQSATVDTGTNLGTNTKFIAFANHDGSNASAAVNGATATTTSDTSSISVAATPRIGARSFTSASSFWDGTVNELIIYASDQTANRTAIEANIGEAYSITGIPAYDDEVDGFVETWYDQSGNSKDAVQATAGSQPKIVSAGSLLNELLFEGSQVFDSITLSDSAQPNSIFTVSNTNVASQTRGIYGTNSTQAGYYRSSNKHAIFSTGTGSATLEGAAYVADRDYLRFDLFNGASSVLGVDGNTTSGTTGNAELDRLDIGDSTLGGVSPLNGGIKELILYASDQSANRAALETNIAAEYGITLS